MNEYHSLKGKVREYQEVLQQTQNYRRVWRESLKDFICKELLMMAEACKIKGKIEKKEHIKNLETIIFTLGAGESGICEIVGENTKKHMIKQHGDLVYQQLFNGKIQVFIISPHIEGFGDPKPPKMIAIYRPEEIKAPFLERHMEEFLKYLFDWEDFDDDEPHPPIGFHMPHLKMNG